MDDAPNITPAASVGWVRRTWRSLCEWLHYDRLHYYPALRIFSKDDALARLETYSYEAVKASEPWYSITRWMLVTGFVALILLGLMGGQTTFPLILLMVLLQAASLCWQFALHRQIRDRVNAKVALELSAARAAHCLDCGYDLRASHETCPECGAAVRVGPPVNAAGDGCSDDR